MDSTQFHISLHILAILLLLYLVVIINKPEHIANADIPAGIGAMNAHLYTSGATMRMLGQSFSSTNQGVKMDILSTDNPADKQTVKVLPTERYQDIPAGLHSAANLYTSGATLRALGQVFTSTNQGHKVTLHNSDNPKEVMNVYISK